MKDQAMVCRAVSGKRQDDDILWSRRAKRSVQGLPHRFQGGLPIDEQRGLVRAVRDGVSKERPKSQRISSGAPKIANGWITESIDANKD